MTSAAAAAGTACRMDETNAAINTGSLLLRCC
jgi:hypothetical protein